MEPRTASPINWQDYPLWTVGKAADSPKEETPVSNNNTIEIEKIEEIVNSPYMFSSEKINRILGLIREAKAPKPRDVPESEAWIVKTKDTQEEVIGFRNPGIDDEFPWIVNRKTWTVSPACYTDHEVVLVKRLVPEEGA